MAYTFYDLIDDILKDAGQPMTYQEIWESAVQKGLTEKLNSRGQTPVMSVGSRLYSEVKSKPDDGKYVKFGSRPARFFLRKRLNEIDSKSHAIEIPACTEVKPKIKYRERDLHPLLAKFAFSNIGFNRGRAIYTKTIHHEVSKKNGLSEWTNPDMVGFHLPIDDWLPEVIGFNKISDCNSLRLYSFELKQLIDRSSYRESFFQAVSNSSWAHEGYLVAAEIQQDDDLLAELERLCSSFGIGIIQLGLDDFDASSVLYPARRRDVLDWETINKLADQNPEFIKFISNISFSHEGGRIISTDYDDVSFDVEQYIKEKIVRPSR